MLESPIELPGRIKAPEDANPDDYLVYQPKHELRCLAVRLTDPIISIDFEDFESALIYAKGLAEANEHFVWVPCDWDTYWSRYKPENINVESLASLLKGMHEHSETPP